jgi:hypothetical protein
VRVGGQLVSGLGERERLTRLKQHGQPARPSKLLSCCYTGEENSTCS